MWVTKELMKPLIGDVSYCIGEVVLDTPFYARFVIRVKEDSNVERGIKFLNRGHLPFSLRSKVSFSFNIYFACPGSKNKVGDVVS